MLSVSYDNVSLQDGAGAQLQRLIGIFAISRFFHLKYIHNPLIEILVHAGDQVNSELDYVEYKHEINALVPFKSSSGLKSIDRTISIKHLGTKQLLKYMIRFSFSSKHLHLNVLQPDHVVNRFPGIYKKFRKSKIVSSGDHGLIIAVHVRQSGTNANFVLKGEKATRNLSVEYYLDQLERIRDQIGISDFENYEIYIVTDEPDNTAHFSPFRHQNELWENAGYLIEQEGIGLRPGNIVPQIVDRFPNAKVFRGGRPAEAIKLLSSGTYLVMSRSSLSVVAGLLSSNSKIFYPPKFWYASFG